MVHKTGRRTSVPNQNIPIPSALREADLLNKLHDDILIWLNGNVATLLADFRLSWDVENKRKMVRTCADEVRTACDVLRSAISTKKFTESERSGTINLSAEQLNYARLHLARLTEFTGLSPDVCAPPAQVVNKRLQLPIHKIKKEGIIRKSSGPVIGFVDLYIELNLQSLTYTMPFNNSFKKGKRVEKAPQWCLTEINYEFERNYFDPSHFYCDVRAEIPSFGEMMRQIRFIKEELPTGGLNTYYVVVSPDDRYEDILSEEGIYFIPYDGDE